MGCSQSVHKTSSVSTKNQSSTTVKEDEDDMIGKTFNPKYKVESILGKGSYGTVYKCFAKNINDYVASMKRKIIMDQLERNNLIRMLAKFKHKKLTCIVLPLYGPNIKEVLIKNKFAIEEVRTIADQ